MTSLRSYINATVAPDSEMCFLRLTELTSRGLRTHAKRRGVEPQFWEGDQRVLALATLLRGYTFKGTQMSPDDRETVQRALDQRVNALQDMETTNIAPQDTETTNVAPRVTNNAPQGSETTNILPQVTGNLPQDLSNLPQSPQSPNNVPHDSNNSPQGSNNSPQGSQSFQVSQGIPQELHNPPRGTNNSPITENSELKNQEEPLELPQGVANSETYALKSIFDQEKSLYTWDDHLLRLMEEQENGNKVMDIRQARTTTQHFPDTSRFFQAKLPVPSQRSLIKQPQIRRYVCNERHHLLSRFENASKAALFVSSEILKNVENMDQFDYLRQAALLSAELLCDCFNFADHQVKSKMLKDSNLAELMPTDSNKPEQSFFSEDDMKRAREWTNMEETFRPSKKQRVFRRGNTGSRGFLSSPRNTFKPWNRRNNNNYNNHNNYYDSRRTFKRNNPRWNNQNMGNSNSNNSQKHS